MDCQSVIKYGSGDRFCHPFQVSLMAFTAETMPSNTFSDESLPSGSYTDEVLPIGGLIPLYAQDGTPLTDQDGNQLYAQGGGSSWTDEVLP